MSRVIPHLYLSYAIENHSGVCVQIILEVVVLMLSAVPHHYLRFEQNITQIGLHWYKMTIIY